MAGNPNISPVACIEVAVAEFHERRRHLVDSLRILFEATVAAEQADSSPGLRRIEQFVRSELVPSRDGRPSLPTKIFNEMVRVDHDLARTAAVRRNALSDTTSPSAQSALHVSCFE